MKRPIYFCKSWFRAKKRPTEVWTRDQAVDAYRAGRPFTVLVDSVDKPFCFLEFVRDVIVVGFLDDQCRETLTYVFEKNDGKSLFLLRATYREYKEDTDIVASGSSYLFDRNGSVLITHQTHNSQFAESKTSSIDVKGNFSPIPEFGEYDELIRVERG